MATLNLDENTSKYQIRSYKPGSIQINDQIYTNSLILSPDTLLPDWPPRDVAALTAADFAPVIELKPAILLIGTGPSHVFLPAEIYGDLINQGIGVEIMETRAACRTFNALSAENRQVVAALLV